LIGSQDRKIARSQGANVVAHPIAHRTHAHTHTYTRHLTDQPDLFHHVVKTYRHYGNSERPAIPTPAPALTAPPPDPSHATTAPRPRGLRHWAPASGSAAPATAAAMPGPVVFPSLASVPLITPAAPGVASACRHDVFGGISGRSSSSNSSSSSSSGDGGMCVSNSSHTNTTSSTSSGVIGGPAPSGAAASAIAAQPTYSFSGGGCIAASPAAAGVDSGLEGGGEGALGGEVVAAAGSMPDLDVDILCELFGDDDDDGNDVVV
jgi:hypothetical protein